MFKQSLITQLAFRILHTFVLSLWRSCTIANTTVLAQLVKIQRRFLTTLFLLFFSSKNVEISDITYFKTTSILTDPGTAAKLQGSYLCNLINCDFSIQIVVTSTSQRDAEWSVTRCTYVSRLFASNSVPSRRLNAPIIASWRDAYDGLISCIR